MSLVFAPVFETLTILEKKEKLREDAFILLFKSILELYNNVICNKDNTKPSIRNRILKIILANKEYVYKYALKTPQLFYKFPGMVDTAAITYEIDPQIFDTKLPDNLRKILYSRFRGTNGLKCCACNSHADQKNIMSFCSECETHMHVFCFLHKNEKKCETCNKQFPYSVLITEDTIRKNTVYYPYMRIYPILEVYRNSLIQINNTKDLLLYSIAYLESDIFENIFETLSNKREAIDFILKCEFEDELNILKYLEIKNYQYVIPTITPALILRKDKESSAKKIELIVRKHY